MYTLGMEMNVTELRKNLLSILGDLPAEGIVVTKRGKAVATIKPVQGERGYRLTDGPLIKGKGGKGLGYDQLRTPYELLSD
jgi:antitoxin (DNA-binding transcriptional repressor) of toxin-antitoxin stability system